MGKAAFEAVVAAHHEEIHRYVQRLTWRASEADDLAQETFLQAYRAYRSLPAEANVRAWLFTIATNLCRNHFRAHKRRRTAFTAVRTVLSDADGEGPEEVTEFNEVRALVETIVDRLPFKQRLAFILRKIHDLDYEVIGQNLNCSTESARAHVYQALGKIRRGLNGYELLPKEHAR